MLLAGTLAFCSLYTSVLRTAANSPANRAGSGSVDQHAPRQLGHSNKAARSAARQGSYTNIAALFSRIDAQDRPTYTPTMRRGAGISALSRQTASSASYAALSSTISAQAITDLRAQLDAFRAALVAFAHAHRDDVRRDPALRHKFQLMCAAIGVDPLAGSGPSGSGLRSGWADMLGLADWQYELAVQVVDVCVSTRARNGGLIEMDDLLRRLGRLRGDGPAHRGITPEDVSRAIKLLGPLGAGYEILPVGGSTFVRSVPRELDVDQAALLALARAHAGVLREREVMAALGWTDVRARNALGNMVERDGLAWVDEQAQGGKEVWVPSTLEWNEGGA